MTSIVPGTAFSKAELNGTTTEVFDYNAGAAVSNGLLVAFLVYEHLGSAIDVLNLKYNNVAFSGKRTVSSGSEKIDAFFLTAPAAGINQCEVNFSGDPADWAIYLVKLQDTHQSTIVGAILSNSGNSDPEGVDQTVSINTVHASSLVLTASVVDSCPIEDYVGGAVNDTEVLRESAYDAGSATRGFGSVLVSQAAATPGAYTTGFNGNPSSPKDWATLSIEVKDVTSASLLAIDSVIPASPAPGDTVTINLSNVTNAAGKTVQLGPNSIPVDSQDINSVTINSWPALQLLGDKSLDYNEPYPLEVTDASQSNSVSVVTQPQAGYDYHIVTGKPWDATSIYFDDPAALVNGDKHYGHVVSGSIDAITQAGIVSGPVHGTQYEYWLYDVSANVWGTSAIEVFNVGDGTPNQFTFNDQNSVALNTVVESNAITIAGVDPGEPVAITVTGGEYSVNTGSGFGPWSTGPVDVFLNHQVRLRGTSSNQYNTPVNITLNANGVSDVFTITTLVDPNVNPGLRFDIRDRENNNAILANEVDIGIYVYDDWGGSLLYSTATGGSDVNGIVVVDDDLVGAVGASVVVLATIAGGQTAAWVDTVIDLDV